MRLTILQNGEAERKVKSCLHKVAVISIVAVLLSLMKFDWTLESLPMVLELIDQVLALHPGIDWFHIGGDEVRNMFEK